jgi:hypothetical protein
MTVRTYILRSTTAAAILNSEAALTNKLGAFVEAISSGVKSVVLGGLIGAILINSGGIGKRSTGVKSLK